MAHSVTRPYGLRIFVCQIQGGHFNARALHRICSTARRRQAPPAGAHLSRTDAEYRPLHEFDHHVFIQERNKAEEWDRVLQYPLQATVAPLLRVSNRIFA